MTKRLSISMPKGAQRRLLGLKRQLSRISERNLSATLDVNKSLHISSSSPSPPPNSSSAVAGGALEPRPQSSSKPNCAPLVDEVTVDDSSSSPHGFDDEDEEEGDTGSEGIRDLADIMKDYDDLQNETNRIRDAVSAPSIMTDIIDSDSPLQEASIHIASMMDDLHIDTINNTNTNNTNNSRPTPNDLAIRAAEEKKSSVRDSLPLSLLITDEQDCIAPFRKDEIVLGPLLGSGEFSHVYEVESFCNIKPMDDRDDPNGHDDDGGGGGGVRMSKEELNRRGYMKKCEKYHETKNGRYALKHIKEEYLEDALELGDVDAYVQAARDLSLEAQILASLNHPNIIKLRGITHSGSSGFSQGPTGYFLIIDRLFETLDRRIRRWRTEGKYDITRDDDDAATTTANGPGNNNNDNSNNRRRSSAIWRSKVEENEKLGMMEEKQQQQFEWKDEILDERLSIALEISAAVMYLHFHSIVFRDLKPANIGFDVRGDVKIFDFGLARIMPENGRHYNDTFEMSGAGSPRYMAPECLCGESYNMKADVYSFAILFWEILAGEIPYAFARTMHQLADHVVNEDGRPDIHESWPATMKQTLESSFDSDMKRRPEMTVVHRSIKEVLTLLRGGNCEGLSDSYIKRRRSYESFALTSLSSSDFNFSKSMFLPGKDLNK